KPSAPNPAAIQRKPSPAGCGLRGCESAARTTSPSKMSAGSVSPYFFRIELKETSSPWCPSSQFGTSKTIPSSIFVQSVSCGRKINSAARSMKCWISHGHATRSTLIFSRVIHFMTSGRKTEISADAARERSFINGSRGYSVLNRDTGAVENYDFIVGDAADFLTGNDFAYLRGDIFFLPQAS